jgi:O-antigen/teichoic acid export membrane protein
MLNGVLSVLLVGLIAPRTDKIVWVAVGWSAASLIAGPLFLLCRRQPTEWKRADDSGGLPALSLARMVALARIAFPLSVFTAFSTLTVTVPRFFVDGHDGRGALGVYAALSYVFAAGSMITAAMSNVSIPRLARLIFTRDIASVHRLVVRLVVLVTGVGVVGVVAGAMVGGPTIRLLFGAEYGQSSDALLWLTIATALSLIAAVFNHVVLAARRYRIQVWVQATVAAIATAASAILVPVYGTSGAGCPWPLRWPPNVWAMPSLRLAPSRRSSTLMPLS